MTGWTSALMLACLLAGVLLARNAWRWLRWMSLPHDCDEHPHIARILLRLFVGIFLTAASLHPIADLLTDFINH